jgi:hypothetical protein
MMFLVIGMARVAMYRGGAGGMAILWPCIPTTYCNGAVDVTRDSGWRHVAELQFIDGWFVCTFAFLPRG